MSSNIVLVFGGKLTFKFHSSALVRHVCQYGAKVFTVSSHKTPPIENCEHIVWPTNDFTSLYDAVRTRCPVGSIEQIIDTWVGEPIRWHAGSQYTVLRYENVLQLGKSDLCNQKCVLRIPVHSRALHCMFMVCSSGTFNEFFAVSRGNLCDDLAVPLTQDLILLYDHSPVGAWGEDRCEKLQSCIDTLAADGLFVNFTRKNITMPSV